MGAFAALCFAPLIPGAVVLAFSPQSTLNTDLAPQERRFAPARRKFDWVTPPYHDANVNLIKISKALVIYDPYLPEDKAQCSRLIAPNVVHHKIPFFDHATPRLVAKCGVLEQLIKDVTEHGAISPSVFRGLRQKRDMRIWNRRFIEHLDRVGPPSRREKVAALIRAKRPDYYFARPLAPMKNLQISAPVIERKARPLVGFLRFSYLPTGHTIYHGRCYGDKWNRDNDDWQRNNVYAYGVPHLGIKCLDFATGGGGFRRRGDSEYRF